MIRSILVAALVCAAPALASAEDSTPAAAPPEMSALGHMLEQCHAERLSELTLLFRARAELVAARKPKAPAEPVEPGK